MPAVAKEANHETKIPGINDDENIILSKSKSVSDPRILMQLLTKLKASAQDGSTSPQPPIVAGGSDILASGAFAEVAVNTPIKVMLGQQQAKE